MHTSYDLIVIGAGPGGYVAAIRGAQLGMRVAVIEKEALGGVCLNWGCIPTKALLKSAQVFNYIKHAADYGIEIGSAMPQFSHMIKRSQNIAQTMSKGIQSLFKKHKIDTIYGVGTLATSSTVQIKDGHGNVITYQAPHIILATGSRAKSLPQLPINHTTVIGYREALSLSQQPRSMVIIGAGAIGVEFAYFYNAIGTAVTLIEYLPRLLSLEDKDVSQQLQRSFIKAGINVMTETEVIGVVTKEQGIAVQVKTQEGIQSLPCDIVLSAVGVVSNLEDLGLVELGIKTEEGKIVVDDFYCTNLRGVYAIGDIIRGPALAHVASAEGILCVEKIAGLQPTPLDYMNLPSCTYCQPEIASIGYTEESAKAAGYKIKVGKFPFSASGKAQTASAPAGFIKVIFDAQYGEWLGAHMIGEQVTEMISEVVVARKLETTAQEIMKSVHPHPTMSEAIMEAVAAAYQEAIHI